MENGRCYPELKKQLLASERCWLVTGAAGFIGSNLIEELLRLRQRVIALDNFATGHRRNLEDVRGRVGDECWKLCRVVEADICELEACRAACNGADIVLHQAALGSVPRSISEPLNSNRTNVDGFVNMLWAAKECGVRRFVYASSSSVYGDSPELPKVEEHVGQPLSPYAVTKYVNELYAAVFAQHYGMETAGLRYFNVFGPRQDPQGAYAAVVPRWLIQLMKREQATINGDGSTTRDFCYVANVVQANLLAACCTAPEALNQVYNIAVSDRTTLNDLYRLLCELISKATGQHLEFKPDYAPFRPGDIRHSLADISKAQKLLGYSPTHSLREGMEELVAWFAENPGFFRS